MQIYIVKVLYKEVRKMSEQTLLEFYLEWLNKYL